jgi:Cysteine rich repeat
MFTRQVTAASVLAVLLISISGPQAAKAQGGRLAACKADAERICPGVTPGGGKLIQCLKQHQDDVTIGCAKELKAIKTKMGK